MNGSKCHWDQVAYSGALWETDCDETLELNSGVTPYDMGMRFCCFCGLPLVAFDPDGNELEREDESEH